MEEGDGSGAVPLELPASDLDARIERALRVGTWHTCTDIAIAIGSADFWAVKNRLRQESICGYAVHSRRRQDGLWEYQIEGHAT